MVACTPGNGHGNDSIERRRLMQRADRDRVGIIGAGRIGQVIARTALQAGREVVIANSRGPASLASEIATLGAGVTAGTVEDAAAAGIVVLAVPWPRAAD